MRRRTIFGFFVNNGQRDKFGMTLNIELHPVLARADKAALRFALPVNIAQPVAQNITQAVKRFIA